MYDMDPDCTYNISAGESLGFDPITHDAYLSVIEARRDKSN
jgi:phosphonate transport system substrate-binding protein